MAGSYFLSVSFVELVGEEIEPLDRRYDVLEFRVTAVDRSFGIANLRSQISIRPLAGDSARLSPPPDAGDRDRGAALARAGATPAMARRGARRGAARPGALRGDHRARRRRGAEPAAARRHAARACGRRCLGPPGRPTRRAARPSPRCCRRHRSPRSSPASRHRKTRRSPPAPARSRRRPSPTVGSISSCCTTRSMPRPRRCAPPRRCWPRTAICLATARNRLAAALCGGAVGARSLRELRAQHRRCGARATARVRVLSRCGVPARHRPPAAAGELPAPAARGLAELARTGIAEHLAPAFTFVLRRSR